MLTGDDAQGQRFDPKLEFVCGTLLFKTKIGRTLRAVVASVHCRMMKTASRLPR